MQSGNKRGWGRLNKGSPGSPSLGSGRHTVCTSTTHPPNPRVGDSLYEIDTGMHLFYQGPVVGWRMPWGMPWGYQNQSTTGSAGTVTSAGTEVKDAVLGDVTVTLLANRIYGFMYRGTQTSGTVANDLFTGRIRYTTDGSTVSITSTQLASWPLLTDVVGGPGQVGTYNEYIALNLAAGTYNFGTTWQRSAGTGIYTPGGTHSLTVMDHGPNGNPS